MVGLVVVGHSRALARAAVALAAEMLHDADVPIEVAAGLDETAFGTDAVAIAEAITAADRGDGVVVLMDLGSALLSAELALEMLDDPERVLLSPAPLVEGLVAAAVAAAGGASRAEVAAEAAAGLAGKQAHLGEPVASAAPDATGEKTGPAGRFTIANPHGLHARPAARLVGTVRGLDAQVEIRNLSTGSPWVPAASLSRVATLGALTGHELEIRASGRHAEEAVGQVIALAERHFDESPTTTAPDPAAAAAPDRASVAAPDEALNPAPTAAPDQAPAADPDQASAATLDRARAAAANRTSAGAADPAAAAIRLVGVGIPASPGIAIGPAWQVRLSTPDIPDEAFQGAEIESQRLQEAIDAVRADLRTVRAATAGDAAGIFDAHLLLLDDADLIDDVHHRIDRGEAAPPAWVAAADRIAAEFAALGDPYLQTRAADVQAVRDQVLRALLGAAGGDDGEGVLIADDLTPAEAARLDPERVTGVLLAAGSPTSHGAILARTRGVPAVVGLGPAVREIADGTPVALDGGTGEAVVDPSAEVVAGFRRRRAEQAERRERARSRAGGTAVTADGVPIAVGANVGSVADARAAAEAGADLAGLVRTEFLFLGRDTAPGVDEQEAVYREIAAALGGRRITLRTLDVGGDKPLGYAPAPVELNPFLGVRGLRHSLRYPRLFTDQLLAIARVARDTPVSVMFPMVSTVAEVVRARELLAEAVATAGPAPELHVGIMIEVPAAALKAAAFAPYVDFVSIGSNDLTQYALAAERGNAAVAPVADGLDPGVLRLIDAIGRGLGGRATVALCGELGSDEYAVPLLAGLGVRELSVAPPAVPEVKEAVRGTDLKRAAELAAAALLLPEAEAVRASVRELRRSPDR